MHAGTVIEAILSGDRLVWSAVGLLWVVAMGLVLAGPRERAGTLRLGVVFVVACATLGAGVVLSQALAIPRIVWHEAEAADLLTPGGQTWRRLRGPAVAMQVGGSPEVAVPTVDSSGGWLLYGLLEGRVLQGLLPAPKEPPEIGAPRLCPLDGVRCRAWPASWPDPAYAPALREFHWSAQGTAQALAYDAESRLFLREVDGLAAGEGALEIIGRIANDPPREGTASLFVLRRIAGERLQAVRVVATRADSTHTYRMERADVSLVSGLRALRLVAGPMLGSAALCLVASAVAFVLAPIWFAAMLRRRSAARRELARALVLMPLAGGSRDGELLGLATVSDDADWGGTHLPRGTTVSVAMAGHGQPVASRVWFELADEESSDPAGSQAAAASPGESMPRRDRRVGLLVPADAEPFRQVARGWVRPYAYSMAILATGLAAAAPAVVAVAAMVF